MDVLCIFLSFTFIQTDAIVEESIVMTRACDALLLIILYVINRTSCITENSFNNRFANLSSLSLSLLSFCYIFIRGSSKFTLSKVYSL